jgi:hypothetical protein
MFLGFEVFIIQIAKNEKYDIVKIVYVHVNPFIIFLIV